MSNTITFQAMHIMSDIRGLGDNVIGSMMIEPPKVL